MSKINLQPIKASRDTIEKYKIRPSKSSYINVLSNDARSSILGTYEGKCCDSNVFNNNDMHLSRELFEKLMDSDEYKRAMKYKHYIGFLGHPADSDCQDFEHACIVMKDMQIDDDGEITGTFDLVATPVGKIVKAFIDAGVNFGISIRGLGDVDGNGEVDPDQFIFRGFDLVTFPAYDDCIPEFKAIAASTDVKKQATYKKVCAAIDANLKSIKSSETLEFIKEQFPDDSEEFIKVDDRIKELNEEVAEAVADADNDEAIAAQVAEQKLKAMTELYLEAKAKERALEQKIADISLECANIKDECAIIKVECAKTKQHNRSLKRIVTNQINDANDMVDASERKISASERKVHASERKVRDLENKLTKIQANMSTLKRQLDDKDDEIDRINVEYNSEIVANTKLRKKLTSLEASKNSDIEAANNLNLKYQHKIEANSEAISQKDSQIEELKTKLNETVVASRRFESKASNLDDKNRELLSRVEAAEEMVLCYQQAYADMYANALGICLTGLPVTASTTVDELKQMIKSGTSTASISARPQIVADQDEYVEEFEDEYQDEYDDNIIDGNYSAGMVTL